MNCLCFSLQIPDDALSVQVVMVMLVVDTILYMVLVWYIEGVWPGRYGVAKPFYFPFQPSYWLGQKTWLSCSKCLHRGGRVSTAEPSLTPETCILISEVS